MNVSNQHILSLVETLHIISKCAADMIITKQTYISSCRLWNAF